MDGSAKAFSARLSAVGLASLEGRSALRGALRLGLPDDERPTSLSLPWPGLNEALPDRGLPRGVVELTANHTLGGATSVALAAVRAGQARAPGAWCAWIDPDVTLHAPGVVAADVDLKRLLVVRPPRVQLARIALKAIASSAFEVVVVDFHPIYGIRSTEGDVVRSPEVFVRKLAVAAETAETTALLLTDASRPRAVVWPVALRLELARPASGDLSVRVAKDKRGRIGLAKTVPFHPIRRAAG